MEENPGFFRHPKWQIFLSIVVGLLLYIYLTHRLGGADKNNGAVLVDTLLFYGSIVFWFFFFAQFVLPVQRVNERWKVFERLFRYLLGEHGPAIFIQSGEIKEHGSEKKKHGPGIALIDTSSAAMLRTDVRFTRAVGPGVVFTEHNPWIESESEYVASAVDLHHQMASSGPLNSQRQERRWQTSGLTRNGIEVVPNITVFFKLDTQPGRGNTQFGYDESAVRLACTGEGIDPNIVDISGDDDSRRVAWDKLPGLMAADIWREILGHFTLDDLFRELPPANDPNQHGDRFWLRPDGLRYTGLEFIIHHINQLMTQDRVDQIDGSGRVIASMDPFGRVERCLVDSEPYRRLYERGVRVERVIISNLHVRKEIEEQIERQWESTWLQRAIAERELLDQQMADIRESSRQNAMREYADSAVQYLRRLPPGIARSDAEILKQLVDGTLSMVMHEGLLRKRALLEKNQLIELLEWLQKKV
jgi:hypothetical protein